MARPLASSRISRVMHPVRSSQLPVARAVGITVLWVPVRAFTSQAKPTHQRQRMQRSAAVVRYGVSQHRDIERMQSQALGGGMQDLVLPIRRERRHGQRLAARRFEEDRSSRLPRRPTPTRLFRSRAPGRRRRWASLRACCPATRAVGGAHAKVFFEDNATPSRRN